MALRFLALLFGRVRQLGGNEPGDVLLEDGQRHRTDGENGVVVATLIELRAELLLGLGSYGVW